MENQTENLLLVTKEIATSNSSTLDPSVVIEHRLMTVIFFDPFVFTIFLVAMVVMLCGAMATLWWLRTRTQRFRQRRERVQNEWRKVFPVQQPIFRHCGDYLHVDSDPFLKKHQQLLPV